MNNQIHFDSDELYDPSDDSGEEYIPKTREDNSDGTDTSEVIEPFNLTKKLTKSMLGCQKMVDIKDGCLSPTDLNNGSTKQMLHRGRSPSRKESSSGKRRKRRRLSSLSCPSTQTSRGHSSKQSGRGDTGALFENSPAVEQSLPDSASNQTTEDEVADDSLSIPAVCKKKDGSRMYNKKQYCLYCKMGFVKMARHLERAHHNKPEVARAVSFPKGSKERRMHLEHLRNRGNFAHNVDVIKGGAGNLVPCKQPKQDSEAHNCIVYIVKAFSQRNSFGSTC